MKDMAVALGSRGQGGGSLFRRTELWSSSVFPSSQNRRSLKKTLQLQVAKLREGIYCMYDSVLGTRIEN